MSRGVCLKYAKVFDINLNLSYNIFERSDLMVDVAFNTMASQRNGLNLSYEDVALHVGVTRQTVWNWEKKNIAPEVKYLNKLSEILQIDIGILVTYFENRSK